MTRYRYRTAALLGRWCDTMDEAVEDALRAGQAYRQEDGLIVWRDHTTIEESEPGGPTNLHRPEAAPQSRA